MSGLALQVLIIFVVCVEVGLLIRRYLFAPRSARA